jgi:hypothetical protein
MPYSGLFGLSGNPNVGAPTPIGDAALLGALPPQSQSNPYMPQQSISGGMRLGMPAQAPGMPVQAIPALQAALPQAMPQGLSSPSPGARIAPPMPQQSTGAPLAGAINRYPMRPGGLV